VYSTGLVETETHELCTESDEEVQDDTDECDVIKDIFGETEPRGSKIYAIRAPASSTSKEIRDQPRSVGIVFNWESTVGFRRAGDNARAFVFRPNVRGTHGSLEKAYAAAQQFLNEPSLHEGFISPDSSSSVSLLKNMTLSGRFLFASFVVSIILFVSYNGILYLQDYMECRGKNALNSVCIQLVSLQLHVQTNAVKYVEMFFTQFKVGYLLVLKSVIDYLF